MASWMQTLVISGLLLVIVFQLRGIRKALAGKESPQAPHTGADLNLEAWLMELDARGTELLERIASEKAALQQVANAKGEPPVETEKVVAPKKGGPNRQSLQTTIRSMAGQGMPPDEIAKKLGVGKEEIQLMLRLHKKM